MLMAAYAKKMIPDLKSHTKYPYMEILPIQETELIEMKDFLTITRRPVCYPGAAYSVFY